MTMLRFMLIALLTIAVLPWGAYLRGPAPQGTLAVASVNAQAKTALDAPQTVQKPWTKCRKGLAPSACTTDAKALSSSPEGDGLQALPDRAGIAAARLHDSLTERPAVPPPRLG